LAVKWVKLSEVTLKGVDQYMCCRCGEFGLFENMYSAIPFTTQGKQMMQGYIHCSTCARTNPTVAWKQAHDREYAS